MPFALVGKYLDQLCDDASVADYFLHGKGQTKASKRKSLLKVRSYII